MLIANLFLMAVEASGAQVQCFGTTDARQIGWTAVIAVVRG
jgi:hypothetical protein